MMYSLIFILVLIFGAMNTMACPILYYPISYHAVQPVEYQSIFGCVTSDIEVVLCNQHDKHVHLRETGDVRGGPNSEVHNGQSIFDNSDHKDIHDREVTADTKVNYDGNDDVAQIAYTDAIKPCNHKHGYSKEHTHNSIADIKSNLDGTNITTIYLAGYDDQIYKLINDIQKHGIGSEILIYFYLYTNNSYRNICYIYTDKNTLRDCIAKYTHYFCVGHNKNDCICFKSLGHVQSTEKPTVQTGQELHIKPELNKTDYIGSIPGKYIDTEPASAKLADIGNAMSDSKAYYPEKESLGAYEFILPKEKDIKFKDIYIDILKSEKPKALAENQIIQGIDSIKNAKAKIENKNIISNKDNVASLKPVFSKPGAYDFKGIPNGAIEIDSIMKNPDDTNILTDSLNKGKTFITNNNRIYANGITDEEINQGNNLVDIPHVNSPGIETVLQFKPNINKETEDIILLNKSNMQVDESKPKVQIIPNMEIFKTENTISRKPTTGASDIVSEIVSETSSPKIVSDKYFTYSQNSPEHNNALNANIVDHAVSSFDNDNEGTVSLTPAPIPRVEMNPNLEYSKAINDVESTKLDDENIILNPTPSNEMQANEMIPQMNKIEMTANKLDVNTNEAEERNDKNNIMAIDDKPHIHNTDNIKVEPQSYVRDYNNDYPINTQACTNINDQLINDKQNPHFHPWNHLQYGDFYKLNQPILQSSHQTNKVGLFGQSPFNNMLHSIPGGIHMHYDFYGNLKHDTIPGKLSFIRNANLYSLDPVKGIPALNLIKLLPSNYKNTFNYQETVANMKPEAYITNTILHKNNPFLNYNYNLPLTLTASDDILRLNSLPAINRPSLTNYDPLIASDSVGTSVTTLPLKSDSTLSQTAFSQPFRISNSQETNKYFTVAPKFEPMAQDVTATVLPNSANFIPIRLTPAFLHNVSPTLNSYYYKTPLPKSILSTPTDSTYYSFTPVNTYNPFVPVAPINNQIEALYANLSPSLYSSINIPYQSSSKLSEERPYASDDNYDPKSKFISYPSPKEKSYSSNSPALSLSDSEPIASNPFKIKNILAPSSVLPLSSTLMQDKYTHSPLLSNTASYKPCSAIESSLPFKQSKTETNLLEIGKLTYVPTPGYSDSRNPIKSLEPSSNNIVLPNNIMSFTPLNQPLKIPYNNAVFQNMVSYINAVPPNTISSTPDLSLLTPPSNTLDIESSMDIKKYPYIPHSFPVDAKFYSITKPQNSISFVPNFVTTKPNQANLSPISFNGGKYSTLITTQKPTQQNLLISKLLRAQSLEKYLASNEKLENNMSPDIFGSTNTDTYPTEDSKPLVLSPNYLTVPKYTDGNINPWLMSNYQKHSQPKICPSIGKPFDLLMSGNADSMVLKDSKSFLPYSYQPIGTQTLVPTFMNSGLPTRNSLSDPSSGPLQPCRFVENFATPILSNTISPYSYSPGKKQKKVTWIPPCIQIGDPHLHINNLNNNFANIDQIPTGESVSKEVPLKYGEYYGLRSPVSSVEVPQYGLPSQVPCTETTPLLQTGNIDYLNAVPELALQSTIPLMSKTGLQRPTICSMSNPDYTKSFEPNNKWYSVFLGYKTPKFAPNKMFNLNPSSSYPQNEGNSVSSSSNDMNYPFSVSNLVLSVPGFAPPSSNKSSCLQENKVLPKKHAEIPLPQEISKNSATILPFNLDTASKPSHMASIHNHIFPLRSLNSHVHVTSPWNSSPNNLNTLWPSYIPHSKDFIRKDKNLSNFITPNSQNLTPLSSYHNAITTPTFGTADVSASSAVNTPKVISPTALSIRSSVPRLVSWPILNKHLAPCNNLILQKPSDFSNSDDQIKPISKIDSNKAYITYSNLQPLNPETPYSSPMATDTITWSDLYPSSYPQGTKSNSISLPYELPSSSMNVPCSPSLTENPTLTTLSSKGYPYSSLLWKTLLSNQKPELISDFTDTDSTQKYYASSLAQSTRPNFESETPSNSQLNSNYNPDLSISTYLPYAYSKIKETDLNIYQDPVSNTLGYYKYGNTYKNEQMTPTVLENLSQIVHTNEPYYLETSANIENMQQSNNKAMNKINNDLNKYMKQRHVISNNLNGNLINIPLHNMGILQYEPKLCKVSYMKTNNPDIYLKIWPAAFTIVKPHIAFEIDKFTAVNFCPVVKTHNSRYTNEHILNVVENFVKTFYGEPIIVKTVDGQKSYAVVDNIDESCIKNGKVYILWANVCDCGCNRIGCHCTS